MTSSKKDLARELIVITQQLLIESGETHHKEVTLDHSLQRHLGIDSLGRAELFRRIEHAFDVRLPDQLLAQAETLRDIAQYIEYASPTMHSLDSSRMVTSHGEKTTVSLAHASTLIDVLHSYAEKAPNKPHIYFQTEQGQQEVITYGHLFEKAQEVAFGLRGIGLFEGDTVAIMQPTHPDFFYAFFGVLLAGGTPVPIYPPFRMHQLDAYAKTESRILKNADVRILITFTEAEKLSFLLKAFVPSLKRVTTVSALMGQGQITTLFRTQSSHAAMIQYTSGSTADPKGVLLAHQNLLANIRAYGKAIGVTPDDVAVSWLPLYHDMGLIGMWLGSLYHGVPLVLMTPFAFLNRPERWLWAMHYHRGTLSGGPNFAYELCNRKIEPAHIEGLDLSSWRLAANGAEKIYPDTLRQFAKKFAPYGFKKRAILPVYGLAESSVALTIPDLHHDFRIDRIDRRHFETQGVATSSDTDDALEYVSCGKPLEGHAVRVMGDDGESLPERHVGRLQFMGPSSMQGYYNNIEATARVLHDGWIDTGDLAYLADGDVFITGRVKDLIIKAGRNLYPAELEELVSSVKGVRKGCVAAFSVSDQAHETEQLIIVAETKLQDDNARSNMMELIRDVLASHLDVVPDSIVLVDPHVVPKTSSGKLQRSACKLMYLEKRLTASFMPSWWQYVKLSVRSLGSAASYLLSFFARVCYTIYVAIIALMTALPVFIYIWFVSSPRAVSAVQVWSRVFLALAGCRLTVHGKHHLKSSVPVVYAANHASYLDALVMLAILPSGARIIYKKEILSVPVLGAIMRKLDYLPVDRMDFSQGVEDTNRFSLSLKEGHSVMIFPEGTFGYAEGLRPFKLGAFKMAAEAQVPVCPIAIMGTRYILRDDDKLVTLGKITATVSAPIMPKGSDWKAVTQLRQDVREEIAKHCGEPSLDLIVPQTIAPGRDPHKN